MLRISSGYTKNFQEYSLNTSQILRPNTQSSIRFTLQGHSTSGTCTRIFNQIFNFFKAIFQVIFCCKSESTGSSLSTSRSNVNSAESIASKVEEYIYIDFEKEAPRFFFKKEEEHVVKSIESLVDETVHDYMTEQTIGIVKPILEKGFSLLGNQILEHPQLDGWLMKGGGKCRWSWVGNTVELNISPNNYDNLMRVFMAERMTKVIEKEHLDILIPEKRLYHRKATPVSAGFHKKYYVFSKKLPILSQKDTEKAFHEMPETQLRKIACDICTLIKKSGFADAHLGNIRWCADLKKIAIIDTESQGLLIEKSDQAIEEKHSLKKCALVGLHEFKNRTGSEFPIFREEAEKAIQELG